MASDQESGSEEEFYDPDDLSEVHQSIVDNDINLLRQALESGVNINEKFTEDISAEHEGMTPLALASALNKVEAVKLLLSYNADVSVTFAALKTTALMTSSFHGHSEIVRLLLKKGADVRAVDLQGSTALGYAFGGTRNIDAISQLLRAGVDVNHKNMLGMNALLLVAGYGDDKMVKMVLDAGADANATNDFGHSALHLAVVGKRSQLKKITSGQTGQYGLNRRNIDVALKEWARLHRDLVRDGNNETELEKVGQFMMNIGIKLDDPDTAIEDDQEAMNRRVEAVYRYRQDKVDDTKGKKKGGAFDSLLSCGGKRSKKSKQTGLQKSPLTSLPSQPPGPLSPQVEREVAELVERCSRVLRLIIDAGCNIDTMEKTFGVTALDMAILLGDVESTAVLMAAGANPSHLMKMFAMSDLYEAIVVVDKKRVKELLTYDSDVAANDCFTQFNATHRRGDGATDNINADGLTPLAVAAQMPDSDILDIMKLLIKNGAELNKVGSGGSSPLAEAARIGNLKIVQSLVQQGADVELANPEYKNATALTVAVMNRQQPVVDFLIQKGAKVDKLMSDNGCALLKASENDDQPMIEKLLDANLNDNYCDKRGFMFEMAERYQRPDKDVNAILGMISDEKRRFFLSNKPVESEQITANVTIKKALPADNEVDHQQMYTKQSKNTFQQLDMPIPPRGLKPTSEPEVMVVGNGHDRRKKQPSNKAPPKPPTPQESSEEEEEDDEDEEDDDDDEDENEGRRAPVQTVGKSSQPPQAVRQPAPPQQNQESRGARQNIKNKQPVPQPSESESEEEEDDEEEDEEEESDEEEEQQTKKQIPVPVAKPRPVQPANVQKLEQTKQPAPPKQAQPPVVTAKPRPVPPPAADSEEEESSEEEEEESSEEEQEDEPLPQQKNIQPIVQKPQLPVSKPQVPNKPPAVAPKPKIINQAQQKPVSVNGQQQQRQQRPPEPGSESEEDSEEESEEDSEEEEELPPPPPPVSQPPPVSKAALPSSKFNQMIPSKPKEGSSAASQPAAKTLTMPAKFTLDDPSSKTGSPSRAGQKAPPAPARDPTSPSRAPPPLPASRPPVSSGEEESGSEEESEDEGSFEEEDRVAPPPPPSRQTVTTKQQVRTPTATTTMTTTKTVVSRQQVQHDDEDDESSEDYDDDDDESEEDDEEYDTKQAYTVQQRQQKRALHISAETDI